VSTGPKPSAKPRPKAKPNREEKKAATREKLLEAAMRVFARHGYVATSVDEVAWEAGMTKGAVYSNFESKEDLFLALLAGGDGRQFAASEELAPSDLAHVAGADAEERAASWGRHVASLHPNRRNVALFLEMNAFALRNERTRAGTAEHNKAFFTTLGTELADLLDAPGADPEVLGMVAQSLYVGLMMHGAFEGEADPETYARAYSALVAVAKASSPIT
jgi:AcrR family transcriptional regulator